MKINDLIQNIKTKDWLRNHVAYFHEKLFTLTSNGFVEIEHVPKIIIVARKYYSESWQTYPSVSLKELKELLKLQQNAKQSVIIKQSYSKNEQQEGFDVRTTQFNELISTNYSQCFLVPETDLIAHDYESENVVLELETPAGSLFYALTEGKTHSAYKKGLVSSLNVFSLSVGLSDKAKQVELDSTQYSQKLWAILKNYPLSKINKLVSSDFRKSINTNMLHATYWAPLISAALFIFIVNGYFMLQYSALEDQLSENTQQINSLLSKKQSIDDTNSYVLDVSSELSSLPRVLSHFQIAHEAIKAGMDIQQFRGTLMKSHYEVLLIQHRRYCLQ